MSKITIDIDDAAGDWSPRLNRVIERLADGDEIEFTGGSTLRLETQVRPIERDHISIHGHVAIQCSPRVGIVAAGCSGFRFSGPRFVGPHTARTWEAETEEYRESFDSPLKLEGCTDSDVLDVSFAGHPVGVYLNRCDRTNVSKVKSEGLDSGANANLCAAVLLRGGRDCRVTLVHAVNHGNAVLARDVVDSLVIRDCSANGNRDNGIYISSGDGCAIVGCIALDCPTGIKARGRRNLIAENQVVATRQLAISITGYERSGDRFGCNTNGCLIVDNFVSGSLNTGISVSANAGFYARDCQVAHNQTVDHRGKGKKVPLEIDMVRGARVLGNYVEGFASDTAMMMPDFSGGLDVGGTQIKETLDYHVAGNTFIGGAWGVDCKFTRRSRFIDNSFAQLTRGFHCRGVHDSIFRGNIQDDREKFSLIHSDNTHPSSGNRIHTEDQWITGWDTRNNTIID